MSGKVMGEVFDCSRAEDAAFVVLLAIADNAGHERPIAWPGQNELVRKARRSERAVRDGLRQLEELGEIETRQAKRGRVRFNVYRVTVGRYRDVEIRDEDVPFRLDQPFSRPAELAARQADVRAVPHAERAPGSEAATTGNGRRPSGVSRPAESNTHDRQRAPRRPAESDRSLARACQRTENEPSGEPESEPSAAAAAVEDLAAIHDADLRAELNRDLDALRASPELRRAAWSNIPLAIAWVEVAKTEATRNPAAFILAGLQTGEHPSPRRYHWPSTNPLGEWGPAGRGRT